MDTVNIDQVVDYKKEYSAAVHGKITGDHLVGLCPFHKDKKPSFSVDLKTGKFTCFACGKSGNFINFTAEMRGISTKDAYKEILREHGIEEAPAAPAAPAHYTVEDYAKEKHLDPEWLKTQCRLESAKEKRDGSPYIKIPYMDATGKVVVTRKRTGKHSFKWGYGAAGKLIPYGMWRIEGMRIAGYTVLVEGESDTQTLWTLGFPALGIPGASAFKQEWVPELDGIGAIYLHNEGDQGGETFIHGVATALRKGGYTGDVFTFSCTAQGVKDPSDLWIKYGDDAHDRFSSLLAGAKPLDLESIGAEIPAAIPDAPIHLRQPTGWFYSDSGICRIDEKTQQPVCVCRTPIILTKRLKRTDTGEEKIEIAWKRDDQWKSATFPRSVIFQSRSVTVLADKGCTVTSENAKQVVRFLGALEQENIDVLGLVEATATFGWQGGGRFLPGHAPGLELDVEPSMARWAGGYLQSGTLEAWVATMRPHRQRYRFRFILAASFAAPLLSIIKQRIFFVYNWGGSRGGKTAALKAALSAWGDPERLMANFNATQVALERMAGFYCDLPLGIDERQLAGGKQESLERIVYMLANGTGRSRGAKDGGLQELRTWRSVIMATGEEPIGRANSQTGIDTRILEVVGAPFDDEAAASDMHQQAALNCGWAGPQFIDYILQTGPDAIIDEYTEVLNLARQAAGTENGSHTASIATVVLADRMISRCLFGESEQAAIDKATQMMAFIVGDLQKYAQPDVNEQAALYISDWINASRPQFAENAPRERYGAIEGSKAYILPSYLREHLEGGGFNYRKTMTWLVDKGIAKTRDGKFTTVKRYDGQLCRMVCLDLDGLQSPPDETGMQLLLDDGSGDADW